MLTQKFLQTLLISDRATNQFQQNVKAFVEPIAQIDELDRNWIRGVSLGAGPTVQIAHQLGRNYRGYEVTRANGSLQVWDLAADNSHPDQYLVLRFTGTATSADFRVF